jgi:hypothetical protein
MPIDASIPLQVKQIELPNPLAQYAQMSQIQNAQNQNALAQYQLGAAQRTEKAQNVLSEAYQQGYDPVTGKVDYPKVLNYMAQKGGGAQIPAVQEAIAKREQEAVTLGKTKTEVAKTKQGMVAQAWRDISDRPSDANITAHLEDIVASPLYDAAEKAAVQKRANELLALPFADRKTLLASTGATAGELRPTMTSQTLGGTTRIMQTPAFGGTATVVPGSEAATTATPGQILTNETAKERNRIARQQLGVSIGHLTLAQQAQNKPIFNAEAGGFVTPPTKENPQGTFTPITGVQSNKDQQGAIKALRSAGYDPVTGEDNISKLIKKSTSGALQAGGASIASFFGQSTDGKEAISALAGTANQIALDLVGGKLGAGISNTDRDFIVSALGDVANPMKSAGERLAGWEAAKTRMLTTGLVPPPAPVKSSSGKTTPSAAPAAPNIDKLLEKYK